MVLLISSDGMEVTGFERTQIVLLSESQSAPFTQHASKLTHYLGKAVDKKSSNRDHANLNPSDGVVRESTGVYCTVSVLIRILLLKDFKGMMT